MVIIIGFALAGFVLMFLFVTGLGSKTRTRSDDYVSGALFGLMAVMISGLIGSGIALMLGLFTPMNWSEPKVYQLAAMRSDTGIHGSFFLGSGQVNGGWVYRYYVKSGNALVPGQLNVNENNVYVVEIEQGTPRLEVIYYCPIKDWRQWFVITGCRGSSFSFFVPKGSVKEGFDI